MYKYRIFFQKAVGWKVEILPQNLPAHLLSSDFDSEEEADDFAKELLLGNDYERIW